MSNNFVLVDLRGKLQHLEGECASLATKLEEGRRQVEHLERENTRMCVEMDCLQLADDDEHERREADMLVRYSA